MWTSLPIPTPPGVIKAPVNVLVELVVVLIVSGSVMIPPWKPSASVKIREPLITPIPLKLIFVAKMPPLTCSALPSGLIVEVLTAVESILVTSFTWRACRVALVRTFNVFPMKTSPPIPTPPGVIIAPVWVPVEIYCVLLEALTTRPFFTIKSSLYEAISFPLHVWQNVAL